MSQERQNVDYSSAGAFPDSIRRLAALIKRDALKIESLSAGPRNSATVGDSLQSLHSIQATASKLENVLTGGGK